MKNVLLNLITGIASGIILYGLVWLFHLTGLTKKIIKRINDALYPVKTFADTTTFVTLLIDALKTYEGDQRHLVIQRALPMEFTSAFFERLEEQPNQNLLNRYFRMMNDIVFNSDGAFDYSIYGKTNKTEIDKATKTIIDGNYFGRNEMPGTSWLGIHDNLNEVGVILIGKCQSVRRQKQDKGNISYTHGFLVVFSYDYQELRGFMLTQDENIRNLNILFDQKAQDAFSAGAYWDMEKINANTVETIRERLHKFFLG